MSKKTSISIVALTDKGLERSNNEDYHGYIPDLEKGEYVFFENRSIENLAEKGALLVVADGMGGTNAGEVASKLAVESIKEFVIQQAAGATTPDEKECKTILFDAIAKAQKDLLKEQQQNKETRGMGTTVVIAWIVQNQVFAAWVGDSRLYLCNAGGLRTLTTDHSYVQELVDDGKLTPEQAFYHPQNNIITQSLGDSERPPLPGFVTYNIQPGDILMLCSDGLNGMLPDSDMEYLLSQNTDIIITAKTLLQQALKAGGHDNITIMAVQVLEVKNALPPAVMHIRNSNMPNDASISSQKTNFFRKHAIKILLAIIAILLLIVVSQNHHLLTKKGDEMPVNQVTDTTNSNSHTTSEIKTDTLPAAVQVEKQQTESQPAKINEKSTSDEPQKQKKDALTRIPESRTKEVDSQKEKNDTIDKRQQVVSHQQPGINDTTTINPAGASAYKPDKLIYLMEKLKNKIKDSPPQYSTNYSPFLNMLDACITKARNNQLNCSDFDELKKLESRIEKPENDEWPEWRNVKNEFLKQYNCPG